MSELSITNPSLICVADVRQEAESAGLSWAAVHRAADALGVIREKNGFTGGWQWRFPKTGNTPKVPMKTPDTVNMASSFVRDPYVLTTTTLSPKVPRAINKESGKYVASSADDGRIRQKLYGLARELSWPAAMPGVTISQQRTEEDGRIRTYEGIDLQ
jgi:hypothetical protein